MPTKMPTKIEQDLQATIDRLTEEHRQFRIKTREVAMRYAKQHGLCTVVERALAEAGIGNERVRLRVTALVPRVIVADVPAELVEGKDDEALVEAAQKFVDGSWTASRAWQDCRIVSDNTRPATHLDVEPGPARLYVLRASGYRGRVFHYVDEEELTGRGIVTSLCGQTSQTRHYWITYTCTGSDRVCHRCNQRMENL